MGHKLFFMVIFTLTLGGVAFVTAFSLNALPTWVYTFVYDTVSVGSQSSKYPYLTKFEGHWETTFTPLVAQTQIAQCDANTGTLTIKDGRVSGTLGALNRYVTIKAEINEEGIISGKTLRGQGNEGMFRGTILKGNGAGQWTDAFDCSGSFAMKKLDAVYDPLRGMLVSFGGEVMLTRGGKSRLPTPGQSLYVGDKIEVPSGGSAHLSIDLVPMDIAPGTSYTVVEKTK